MEILYKAKDGKIFENEWECEEYELALDRKERADDLIWVNKECNRIPITHDFDAVFGFVCLSAAAVNFMKDLLYDEGLRYKNFDVNEPCWYYEENDCFVPIYEKVAHHKNIAETEENKAYIIEQGGHKND